MTGVSAVGTIEDHAVYKITSVRFYSLISSTCDNGAGIDYFDVPTNQMLPHPCADVHKYFASGAFYFSYSLDLTSSMQRRSLVSVPGPNARTTPWDSVNERFLFNRYLLKDLLRITPRTAGTRYPPLIFCIQGFVEVHRGQLRNEKYSAAIISRLSGDRVGTRFNTRGINDGGHVANFVETEQIVTLGGMTYAAVIVRGSVPLFWEQKGIQLGGHRIDFARTIPASLPAARRHMNDLHLAYGAIRVVNLLAQKNDEQVLSDAYRRIVTMLDDPLIKVTNFDSHYHLKENFENISLLLAELGRDIKNFSFFTRDNSTKEVVSKQEGIFRVNCVDCLDRYGRDGIL